MMWWYYGQGYPWLGMLMMVVFWAFVLTVGVILFRAYVRPRERHDSALDTLRSRLASGQITPEEFEKTRKILEG